MDTSLDDIFDTSLDETGSLACCAGGGEEEEEEKAEKKPNRKKVVASPQEMVEIKRAHDQRISALKQRHLTKEQTMLDSNEIKYRDYLWDITLKYFGRGSYTTNLAPLFEKNLIDEEFKLKKEILALQESQKEEIRATKEMHDANQKKIPKTKIIDPKAFAEQLFMQIRDSGDDDDIYENDGMIDKIYNKLNAQKGETSNISDNFEEVFVSPPKREPKIRKTPSPKYFSPPKQIHSPPLTHTQNRQLQRHINERNKLKKSIEATDKFMQSMKKQTWFADYV